jgi:hypothetical protein
MSKEVELDQLQKFILGKKVNAFERMRSLHDDPDLLSTSGYTGFGPACGGIIRSAGKEIESAITAFEAKYKGQ